MASERILGDPSLAIGFFWLGSFLTKLRAGGRIDAMFFLKQANYRDFGGVNCRMAG